MDKLECHSGTKKEELLAFVEKHRGEKIEVHHENNITGGWGDDDIAIYKTSDDVLYDYVVNLIKTHYIHNLKVIN